MSFFERIFRVWWMFLLLCLSVVAAGIALAYLLFSGW